MERGLVHDGAAARLGGHLLSSAPELACAQSGHLGLQYVHRRNSFLQRDQVLSAAEAWPGVVTEGDLRKFRMRPHESYRVSDDYSRDYDLQGYIVPAVLRNEVKLGKCAMSKDSLRIAILGGTA